jgi:hypothetical protein
MSLPNTTNNKGLKGTIEIDPKETIVMIVQTEGKDTKEASVMIEATGMIAEVMKEKGKDRDRDREIGTDTKRDNQAKIGRETHITLETVDVLQQIIPMTIPKDLISPATVIFMLRRHSVYDSSRNGRVRSSGRALSFFNSKSQCGKLIKLCSVLSSSLQYGFL